MKRIIMVTLSVIALTITISTAATEIRTQLLISKLSAKFQLNPPQTQLLREVIQSGQSLKESLKPKSSFNSLVKQKLQQKVIWPEILIEDYRQWSKEIEKKLLLTLDPLSKLHSSLSPSQRSALIKGLEEEFHE